MRQAKCFEAYVILDALLAAILLQSPRLILDLAHVREIEVSLP